MCSLENSNKRIYSECRLKCTFFTFSSLDLTIKKIEKNKDNRKKPFVSVTIKILSNFHLKIGIGIGFLTV